MGDFLKTCVSGVPTILRQVSSRSVTYSRGGAAVVVYATLGASTKQFLNEYGIAVIQDTTDYLIETAVLILSGSTTTPQRGDTITDTTEGTTKVMQVVSVDGMPPWRYMDRFRTMLRIHTQLGSDS